MPRPNLGTSSLLLNMAVLLVLTVSGGCNPSPRGLESKLRCNGCNLLFISIDTLRADRLGCYGNPRDVSPQIDKLASQSILFENAQSVSYHTADSHMSIFTSLYPSVHGIRNATNLETVQSLSGKIETFTEVLQAKGYKTAGFHGGGNVAPVYGFDRGFDIYQQEKNIDKVLGWMGENRDESMFIFFHTYRVHDPYLPSPPYNKLFDPDYDGEIISEEEELKRHLKTKKFKEKRDVFWERVDSEDPEDIEHLKALYDGAIREIDAEIGRLVLAAEALPRKTLIVLTSDHGEEFYEHGRFLHDQLYNEVLHVPLMIRHPDHIAGRRIGDRVSLINLAPTILDILGIAPLSQAQGMSLVPLMTGGKGALRPVISEKFDSIEAASPPSPGGNTVQRYWRNVSIVLGRDKLLSWPKKGRPPELYDMEADPSETQDRASRDQKRVRELLRILEKFSEHNDGLRQQMHSGAETQNQQLDEETVEQLKALGYV